MFKAYCNNQIFFNAGISDDALTLAEAKLDLEVGKAGSFTFKIYPTNIGYNYFQKFKSYVSLYREDRLIFSGRVLEEKKGFSNEKTIICEGLLAMLNDSIIRPFSFQGTITEFLTMLINNHNSQVSEDKQFTLGTVTVTDPNNYIARSREGYNSTMALFDDTVSTLGGYFVVRPENGALYIDYLEDFTAESGQEVNFGENLLDITKESSGTELITALIPLGAESEETQEDGTVIRRKLTIESVNDGNDYLTNTEAIEKYGFILGTHEWNDVTRPENLKTKGEAYLAQAVMEKTTINISAVDMAKAGADIDSFLAGEYVNIKSSVHSIDAKMLIKKQSLNLLNPSQNKLTVGDTVAGYVESGVKNTNKYETVIQKIEANYVTNQQVTGYPTKEELAEAISKGNDDVINSVKAEMTAAINESAEEISLEVSTSYATKEELATEAAKIKINSDNIAANIETIEGIVTSVKVTDAGVEIGKSDSEIKSVQDNDSYAFVDKSGTKILELDTKGVNAPSVNISKQLKIGDGWAIRQGEYVSGKGYNLNDVWIGG